MAGDIPCRARRSSNDADPSTRTRRPTAETREAAGRPPQGNGLGEGEVLAQFASGEAIVRHEPAVPMVLPPAMSRQSQCGPDRALHSLEGHNHRPSEFPTMFTLAFKRTRPKRPLDATTEREENRAQEPADHDPHHTSK